MSDEVSFLTRPVAPGDEEFLCGVYVSTRAEEVAAFGWPHAQQEAFLRMQYRMRCQSYAAAYPEADFSVLLLDGVAAGYTIVARSPSEIRLVDIALLPQYRGCGLGTKSILPLICEADEHALPLRLSVARGNRALRLYQRLGFEAVFADAVYIEMERHAKPG